MGEFAEAGGSPHQGQITAIPFESITATDRYTGYNGEIDLGWGDRNAVFSRIWIDQDLKRDMGH